MVLLGYSFGPDHFVKSDQDKTIAPEVPSKDLKKKTVTRVKYIKRRIPISTFHFDEIRGST